jgi:hypothetical protein
MLDENGLYSSHSEGSTAIKMRNSKRQVTDLPGEPGGVRHLVLELCHLEMFVPVERPGDLQEPSGNVMARKENYSSPSDR